MCYGSNHTIRQVMEAEPHEKRTRDRINEAKLRARPGKELDLSYLGSGTSTVCILSTFTSSLPTELKNEDDWCRCSYWKSFPVSKESVRDNCERISYLEVDEATFIERFERPRIPVVITDSQLDWQANKKWTIEVS